MLFLRDHSSEKYFQACLSYLPAGGTSTYVLWVPCNGFVFLASMTWNIIIKTSTNILNINNFMIIWPRHIFYWLQKKVWCCQFSLMCQPTIQYPKGPILEGSEGSVQKSEFYEQLKFMLCFTKVLFLDPERIRERNLS